MAVAVSMANEGRDVHPFFIPKASELPSSRFTLTFESFSKAKLEQISDSLRRKTLVGMTSNAKSREPSHLVGSLLY